MQMIPSDIASDPIILLLIMIYLSPYCPMNILHQYRKIKINLKGFRAIAPLEIVRLDRFRVISVA